MLRLTLKNLRANKVRFTLTTLGVVLAVSFVVSAFVLGDGLRSTFGDVSEDITAGVDIEVRPANDFGDPVPLSAGLVAQVAAVDGVFDAVANIEAPDDAVRPIPADGDPITTQGPPQLAFAWSDNEAVSPFSLVAGQPPGIDEFSIDLDSAATHDFVIGETYDVITPSGRRQLTLSGTSTFGADNDTVGAVLMQMNVAQAGELFGIDGVTTIQVQVTDGADPAAVQAAIAAALPTLEVVDHDTVVRDTTEGFTGEIDIIGNILLGFGGISLFVSIFIIYNTFAIVLSQRTKELALLRTIGADPRQIRRSVIGEALFIGVLASGLGIVGGVGVAKGLEALFNATGGSLPESPTILATRTIVAALVIGIGVTLIAAVGPARRASTVPAIAAMRGTDEATNPGSRTRILSGTGLLTLGAITGTFGLTGAGSTAVTVALMATGAVSIFLGVTLLSPMTVGVITRVLGWPLARLSGVSGSMAQQNAARNPRRTATTAAALMIGLALVSTSLIVGQSIKSNFGTTLEQSATGDYYVTDQLVEVDFPLELPAQIASNTELFDAVAGFRYVETRVDGEIAEVVATDFTQLLPVMNADVREGDLGSSVDKPVLVAARHAEESGLVVGDMITTEFANGAAIDSTITGVFYDEALITSDFLYDESTFDAAGDITGHEWLAISLADGASLIEVDAVMASLSEQMPHADVETTNEFRDRVEGMIDDLLAIVNIMVALAVVIALIGIANTLALSVFERTRELGLVRAVGMTRRQLRRMVRFEAALVATFGAVLGVAVGLLFGWGVVHALPDDFASAMVIPVQSILTLVVVAALAGVVAAVLPARRAGRLNVLDAISH